MKEKRLSLIAVGFASVLSAAIVYAGGWVIVTVAALPEYGIVGKPLHLTFMVRDPGLTPREDFTPAIAASSGTEVVRAGAAPTKKAGDAFINSGQLR